MVWGYVVRPLLHRAFATSLRYSFSAYAPGSLPSRLFRVSGVTTSRAVPNTLNGSSLLSRELLLYYNEDGTLAQTFTSPWDQQTYQGLFPFSSGRIKKANRSASDPYAKQSGLFVT